MKNLTSHPTTGKYNFDSFASALRIFDALAKAEIASPFHETITCANNSLLNNQYNKFMLENKLTYVAMPYHPNAV